MKALFLSFLFAVSVMSTKAVETNNIDKITASYISVKDALVGGNAALTQSRAKELLTALSDLSVKNMTVPQQKLVATYLEKLRFDSRHISETTVIDHQREHFASLSKNMYALLAGLKMNSTTVYQQYCPMKKSYWLSESEDIRNPYYGDGMLECGKVTATLKPATK